MRPVVDPQRDIDRILHLAGRDVELARQRLARRPQLADNGELSPVPDLVEGAAPPRV